MTLKSLKAIKTPFSFDTLKKLRWKDFVNEGYIIAGSPATVRERLAHVVRELNVCRRSRRCAIRSSTRAR